VTRTLLVVIAVLGLLFPSAGLCAQSAKTRYEMPCCAGAACAMGEQMHGRSCCASFQGRLAHESIAPPAPPLVHAGLWNPLLITPPVRADQWLAVAANLWQPPPAALHPHPLQI
jgi:hypothetical protein